MLYPAVLFYSGKDLLADAFAGVYLFAGKSLQGALPGFVAETYQIFQILQVGTIVVHDHCGLEDTAAPLLSESGFSGFLDFSGFFARRSVGSGEMCIPEVRSG